MDVREFSNELRRMFESLSTPLEKRLLCEGVECIDCPFEGDTGVCRLDFNHLDEVIDTVVKWSEEHPKPTYKDALLERLPNVKFNDDGTPNFCPDDVGLAVGDFKCLKLCGDTIGLYGDCTNCWNSEYVEGECK